MRRYFTISVLLSVFVLSEVRSAAPTAKIYQDLVPVLAGRQMNRTLVIEIIPTADTPFTLTEVTIGLAAMNGLTDIRSVSVHRSAKDKSYDPIGIFGSRMKPAPEIVFAGAISCTGDDKINLWVFLELNEQIDLRNKYTVECLGIKTLDGEATIEIVDPVQVIRPGIAVRDRNDDGVHTYRIPGLATTNEGTLLAVYDVRYDSNRDLQGHMDIGLSRSTDRGATWEPMRIIIDMGDWGGLPEKFNGVSDANVLVDRSTGDIYVTGLWMHGVLDKNGRWIEGLDSDSDAWMHQWRDRGSQPGYGVKQTSQALIVRSGDDGKTWSEPVNITRMVKRPGWWLWAPSPGNGITMSDGTLVMPSQGRDATGRPFSNITWSKDRGRTWISSKPAYANTTESSVVELSNGSLMLNMRYNGNRDNLRDNGRVICVTDDLGRSWTEHPTSKKALIEPVCMGNLYKHRYDGGIKSLLLFSNPNSKTMRDNHGIKVSFDDGATWPEKYWILLDKLRSAGYSCMTSVDEKTIGILYESSQANLVFQLVDLDEIINLSR